MDNLTTGDCFWVRLSGLPELGHFRISIRTQQPLYGVERERVGWQCWLSTADPIYNQTNEDIPVVLSQTLHDAIVETGHRHVIYKILGTFEVEAG